MNLVDRLLNQILAEGPAPVEAPPRPSTLPPHAPPGPSRPRPGTRPTIPTRRPRVAPRPKAKKEEEFDDVRGFAMTDLGQFSTPTMEMASPLPPPPTDDDQEGLLPPALPRSRFSRRQPRKI